ncbi:hypothetical protein BBP40_009781 [Aspergillus hancockii]|nr:hypothetical protein BBP40_009781 [Aspergillus hancockii]
MGGVNSMLDCFPSSPTYKQAPPTQRPRARQEIASDVVNIILTAESASDIKKRLEETVSTASWTESLAKAILHGVENAITAGAQMAEASSNALSRAKAEAFEFAHDYPVFVTILAIGVLAS